MVVVVGSVVVEGLLLELLLELELMLEEDARESRVVVVGLSPLGVKRGVVVVVGLLRVKAVVVGFRMSILLELLLNILLTPESIVVALVEDNALLLLEDSKLETHSSVSPLEAKTRLYTNNVKIKATLIFIPLIYWETKDINF